MDELNEIQEIVQKRIKEAQQQGDEIIAQQIQEEIHSLKPAIQGFLRAYENYQNYVETLNGLDEKYINQVNKTLMKKHSSSLSIIGFSKNFKDKDLAEQKALRLWDQGRIEQYKATVERQLLDLQNAINAVMKKQVKIVYTITGTSGHTEFVVLDNTIDNLNLVSKFGITRLMYQLNNEFKAQNNEWATRLGEYNSQSLDETNTEVYRRYNIARAKAKTKAVKAIKGWPVLYQINNKWHVFSILNAGYIDEAYINFFFHKIQFKQGLEENVAKYLTDKQHGVNSVSNLHGLFTGDVEIDGFNLAVKRQGAGPMRSHAVYEQVSQLFTAIDNMTNDDIIKKIGVIKNNLEEKEVKQSCEKLTQESVEALVKTLVQKY